MNAEFWREKRVLVTGHTGFKGSWLTLCLIDLNAEVIGYALPPPTRPSLFELADVGKGIDSHEGNILDLAHLRNVLRDRQPEIIVHLAAQSLVRPSYRDPLGTYATNVMGTANLLEAVREVPSVKAVIVVTSDKCYQNHPQQPAFRETDPLGGNDPYSSSKAAAELVAAAYRQSFFQSSKQAKKPGVAAARAGNVIGGGDWAADRLVPDVMRAIASGKRLLIRNPDSVRPWQHVLDPLDGYLLLAEKLFLEPERFAESWNFGPEETHAWPVSAVLNLLRELWGPEVNWHRDDSPQPHESRYLRLDSTKAKAQLGWEPRWNLKRAVEATAQWYRGYFAKDDLRALTLQQIRAFQATVRSMETSRT